MFNTLAVLKKLEEAGIPRRQAEAQVEVLSEIVAGELATKADIQTLDTGLKELDLNLRAEIKGLETDLKRDMKELESRLTIRLSAIIGTMITVLGALIAMLKS